MGARLDLVGKTFGRLTVTEFAGIKKQASYWRCKCSCGSEVVVAGACLTSGNTTSCGCRRVDRVREVVKKHDGNGTRLYRIWKNMRTRCRNPHFPQYKDYGGKGIDVCNGWDDFVEFKRWADSHGYSDGLTIDRIDCSKGYSPDNCRWVDIKTQQRNRTSVRKINGKTVSEWSEISGISYNTLLSRLKKMMLEEALSTPVASRKKIEKTFS